MPSIFLGFRNICLQVLRARSKPKAIKRQYLLPFSVLFISQAVGVEKFGAVKRR